MLIHDASLAASTVVFVTGVLYILTGHWTRSDENCTVALPFVLIFPTVMRYEMPHTLLYPEIRSRDTNGVLILCYYPWWLSYDSCLRRERWVGLLHSTLATLEPPLLLLLICTGLLCVLALACVCFSLCPLTVLYDFPGNVSVFLSFPVRV